MAMTRKHYREVAEIIRSQWQEARRLPKNERIEVQTALMLVASGMATMFQIDNSRFDREKFLAACVDLD